MYGGEKPQLLFLFFFFGLLFRIKISCPIFFCLTADKFTEGDSASVLVNNSVTDPSCRMAVRKYARQRN